MHSTERGTDRNAETEINSLARSISQLIFHEGFSPSPLPVFFRLWNDQGFPRGTRRVAGILGEKSSKE